MITTTSELMEEIVFAKAGRVRPAAGILEDGSSKFFLLVPISPENDCPMIISSTLEQIEKVVSTMVGRVDWLQVLLRVTLPTLLTPLTPLTPLIEVKNKIFWNLTQA